MLASVGSYTTLDDESGIGSWYVRRVSFWNDCDEPIQEWLSNVQELAESEDPLL